MDKLINYFDILLKHFNIEDTINIYKSDNKIFIKSNVSWSPFIKELGKVNDQVKENIKKAIILIDKNINVDTIKMLYDKNKITISFNKYTYLDTLPNELLNLVVSFIDIIDKYGDKYGGGFSVNTADMDNLEKAVNRQFLDYDQIIGFKYPELAPWIFIGGKLTEKEFDILLELDSVSPKVMNFLKDIKQDIINYEPKVMHLNAVYLIKMRQHFPHFKGIEFEYRFAPDLYQVYKNALLNHDENMLNFILTGNLLKPLTNIQALAFLIPIYFIYHLLKDPLITIDAEIPLLSFIVNNDPLLRAYKSKLTQSKLDQLVELIGDKSFGNFVYKNIIDKLTGNDHHLYKYMLRNGYPHFLKYIDKHIKEDKLAEDIIQSKYYILRETLSARSTVSLVNIMQFIDGEILNPFNLLKYDQNLKPILIYLLLINPNFRVTSNQEYINFINGLDEDLFELYLSKISKQDIRNIYDYIVRIRHDLFGYKKLIEVLSNYI